MYTLFLKEINGFLNSLIGYIAMAVFLLVNGVFLWFYPPDFNIPESGYASLDGLFVIAPVVFLILIPAITMRSFAEEKRSGTIELLMTRPISDLRVILAKYFAGIVLVIISLAPTLIYYMSVYLLGMPPGNLDSGSIWGSYIGLFFLGSAFVAIGIFCSAVADNQIVAFILALFISFFLYLGFGFAYAFLITGKTGLIIQSLGLDAHYTSMSRGVIDTRDLVYFISVTAVFILLTKIRLEARKW